MNLLSDDIKWDEPQFETSAKLQKYSIEPFLKKIEFNKKII